MNQDGIMEKAVGYPQHGFRFGRFPGILCLFAANSAPPRDPFLRSVVFQASGIGLLLTN